MKGEPDADRVPFVFQATFQMCLWNICHKLPNSLMSKFVYIF